MSRLLRRSRRSRFDLGLTAAGMLLFVESGCTVAFEYDEAVEVCGNGVDDDGDGQTDCGDPDCAGPACPEEGEVACRNGRDDDGDGLVDRGEPACWEHSLVEVDRCASTYGSLVRSVEDVDTGDFELIDDDPTRDSTEPVIALRGPEDSAASTAIRGDDVELRVELFLPPGQASQLEVGLYPTERFLNDELAESLLVSRLGDDVRMTYRQGVDRIAETVTDGAASSWFRLAWTIPRSVPVIDTDGADAEPLPWQATLQPAAEGIPPARLPAEGEEPPSGWPDAWAPGASLTLFFNVVAPEDATSEGSRPLYLRNLRLRRSDYSPCGYPVPQFDPVVGTTSLFAAATDGSVLCVLGQEAGNQITVWRGTRELARWERWTPPPVLAGRGLFGAAMAYAPGEGRFEALVWVREGDLVVLTSPDCSVWEGRRTGLPDDPQLPDAPLQPIDLRIASSGRRRLIALRSPFYPPVLDPGRLLAPRIVEFEGTSLLDLSAVADASIPLPTSPREESRGLATIADLRPIAEAAADYLAVIAYRDGWFLARIDAHGIRLGPRILSPEPARETFDSVALRGGAVLLDGPPPDDLRTPWPGWLFYGGGNGLSAAVPFRIGGDP